MIELKADSFADQDYNDNASLQGKVGQSLYIKTRIRQL